LLKAPGEPQHALHATPTTRSSARFVDANDPRLLWCASLTLWPRLRRSIGAADRLEELCVPVGTQQGVEMGEPLDLAVSGRWRF
jgi:hypothetical protein